MKTVRSLSFSFSVLLFACLTVFGGLASAQALEDWDRARIRAAKDFKLKDLSGTTHSLSQYKGKVVIVNFWATWCPPCVEEMPSLQALQRTLDPNQAVILTINSEDTAAKAKAFLKRHKLDLAVLLDPEDDVGPEWDVEAYPSSYLIDTRGRWRYSTEGDIDFMGKETRGLIARLIEEGKTQPAPASSTTTAAAAASNPPITPPPAKGSK